MSAIDVQNIVKTFGDFTAVKGITFEVPPGEIFGLLGPNGAGKSTLIRMLTTLLPPTAGTALISGFDVAKEADGVRRVIGVIPQAMTSDLELSVEENLLIFAKLYGVPRAKRKRLIDELLEAVELTAVARQAGEEPLGRHAAPRRDRPRPGARAEDLLPRRADHRPRSRVARARVGDAAEASRRERDLTVLITTHYMDEADKLCDRIAIVDHGELMALDSPMKLKASDPGKNVLEVSFSRVPADWAETPAALPEVADVTSHDHVFRIATGNGPATTMALLQTASRARRRRAVAGRPEHDARRRVRALHRARASRRAAGSGAAATPS